MAVGCSRAESGKLYLHLEHAERDLEEDDRALVEEEVPDAEEDTHVDDAGEGGEEPVKTDERQL